MTESDYPALYQSADSQAGSSQSWFIRAIVLNFACIVLSSVLSTINSASSAVAIVQTVILLIGMAVTAYFAFQNPQQAWYGSRALAESIKTVTWRYMMRAEPYNIGDQDAVRHFIVTLRKLFEINSKYSSQAIPVPSADEITAQMRTVRAKSLNDRKAFYLASRIDNQRNWYIAKSTHNKKLANRWLGVIFFVYLVLICFAVAKPAYPDYNYWPTDTLLTLASSFLAWVQTKRYQELSASYALTAHEISILKAEMPTSTSEDDFSTFVGDAENAFSREHTQWQARRDRD